MGVAIVPEVVKGWLDQCQNTVSLDLYELELYFYDHSANNSKKHFSLTTGFSHRGSHFKTW